MKKFGLIGKNISYSFSKRYFTEKFQLGNISDCAYENFDIPTIETFPQIIKKNPDLCGLNVTVPYKEEIIPFLNNLSSKAKDIGAVNTIRFMPDGTLKGYNTDYHGFRESLEPMLKVFHRNALILGTGGASKAVAYALNKLGIGYKFVSRQAGPNVIDYSDLHAPQFAEAQIIINCTPLGTTPKVHDFPDIPYQFFTSKHIAYDLVYNPADTMFMQKARKNGAITKNGFEMLTLQAEKSWSIWNRLERV